VATALGPRDDAWLDRAVRDPKTAVDIWPWWADATDARYLLNRAMCQMWTEVRWRPPASAEESLLFDEVLGLLRQAQALDPALAYPWREWRQMLELRGSRDPVAAFVRERALSMSDEAKAAPLVGYRRRPVTVVHEGWHLPVPGSLAERRTDEEWAGEESGRSITLAATTTGLDDGTPMPAREFLRRFADHLGDDVFRHDGDGIVGISRLTSDASSGVEIGILEGYAAVAGSGAAIRVVIDDPSDWEWAVETWRSLRHP
jgi:hypothetical protein